MGWKAGRVRAQDACVALHSGAQFAAAVTHQLLPCTRWLQPALRPSWHDLFTTTWHFIENNGVPQKPSKGQRRREQRQREEAEREARIAAELEALGDTGGLVVFGLAGHARVTFVQLMRRQLSECGAAEPCAAANLSPEPATARTQLNVPASYPCPAALPRPPADRVIEERELQALLRPLGLGIRPIPPDGHCLYRSLGGLIGWCCWSYAPLPACFPIPCWRLCPPYLGGEVAGVTPHAAAAAAQQALCV